jgi:hypothetical protein
MPYHIVLSFLIEVRFVFSVFVSQLFHFTHLNICGRQDFASDLETRGHRCAPNLSCVAYCSVICGYKML